MEEKTLLKLATFFALIGIISLAYLSNNMELEFNQISEIDQSQIDKTVKIKGTLTNLISTEEVKILDIKDKTGSIKTIIFQEEELQISTNDLLEISGKVTQYQGQLEIIADTITKFK